MYCKKKVCVVCSLNGEGFVIVAILNMQTNKDRQTKVQQKDCLFVYLFDFIEKEEIVNKSSIYSKPSHVIN